MTTITDAITIISEYGDPKHPCGIEIKQDGSTPDCPVTFWMGGTPVFSMGTEEIDAFCKALQTINCH